MENAKNKLSDAIVVSILYFVQKAGIAKKLEKNQNYINCRTLARSSYHLFSLKFHFYRLYVFDSFCLTRTSNILMNFLNEVMNFLTIFYLFEKNFSF